MAEGRLEAALERVNAGNYFLNGERTENILKRMERQGYIVKIRERDGGGEETVDYMVGPRGKAEIGERGVAGMARRVYGKKDAEKDELERRLVRSLGEVVLEKKSARGEEAEIVDAEPENAREQEARSGRRGNKRQSKQTSGRGGRAAREVFEEEAEVDGEEDEDEDEEQGEEDDENEDD